MKAHDEFLSDCRLVVSLGLERAPAEYSITLLQSQCSHVVKSSHALSGEVSVQEEAVEKNKLAIILKKYLSISQTGSLSPKIVI